MTFPNTELEKVKRKELLKTDLIGLTPGQYILYRINLASEMGIAESSLKFDIDEITMEAPRPTEICKQVAVIKIKPDSHTNWEGEVDYRIPQIDINRYYGRVAHLDFNEIKDLATYNDVARHALLPPKTFKSAEFIGMGVGTLSYRLNFNNPFFEGSLQIDVAGVSNLITDKPIIDGLLGVVQVGIPLSTALHTKVLSGINLPAV